MCKPYPSYDGVDCPCCSYLPSFRLRVLVGCTLFCSQFVCPGDGLQGGADGPATAGGTRPQVKDARRCFPENRRFLLTRNTKSSIIYMKRNTDGSAWRLVNILSRAEAPGRRGKPPGPGIAPVVSPRPGVRDVAYKQSQFPADPRAGRGLDCAKQTNSGIAQRRLRDYLKTPNVMARSAATKQSPSPTWDREGFAALAMTYRYGVLR